MYERFTDRARKVMQLANQEAASFQHCYIGTEHILLALIKEGSGVAANVLKNLGIERASVRADVLRWVLMGWDQVEMGERLPQLSNTSKVIEYAMAEARGLGHNYVGTEHLLLGMLRVTEGVAAQVLMSQGLKLEQVREEIVRLLGGQSSKPVPPPHPRKEIEDLPEPLRPAVAELDAEIQRFTVAKMEAVGNQQFENAALLRDNADRLYRNRTELVGDWTANRVVDRSWLSANDGEALKLAQRISEQRRWDLLPSLAEALEQAGCTDAELLNHCRRPGEHTSHCWVVDLLLAQA